MDWIVRTRDQRDNRGYERRYDTEPDFVSGVNELLENRWQRIVSATLPSGAVLDEEELRQLISTGVPPLWEVVRRRRRGRNLSTRSRQLRLVEMEVGHQ